MSALNKIIIICLGFLNLQAFSQQQLPPLERKISLELKSQSIKEVFTLMEKQGNYSFAYRTNNLDTKLRLSRSYKNQTTREVLDDIFQGNYTYKVKGNYIIIRKTSLPKPGETKLQGYVIDAQTLRKIPFVSIYDTVTLSSAVSDQYGYYDFNISSENAIVIKVNKQGYKDTLIAWNATGNNILNLFLQPIVQDTIEDGSPKGKLKNFNWFKLSDESKANIQNIRNKIDGKFQFSVLPNIGTKGRLSSSSTVDYSVNLFGGITNSVRKAEVATLFNLNVDSVQSFQAAGLFNAVGGKQRGVQMAGFANLNASTFQGGQLAGFLNVSNGFTGLQGAGFTNINLGDHKGFQGAGFMNYNNGSFEGVQAAGFMNFSKKKIKGAQLAGFLNMAESVEGFQGSGFLNIAKKVKGVQLGIINLSDSINGTPIGLFSYAKNGYHNLELSYNEFTDVNLAFRTGSNSFYNIFSGGVGFRNRKPYYSLGYGIGTSVRTSKNTRLFFDLESNSVYAKGSFGNNLLNKLKVSYHWQFMDKMAIAVGPTLNLHIISDYKFESGKYMDGLAPYTFVSETDATNDIKFNAWVGGQISFRFF